MTAPQLAPDAEWLTFDETAAALGMPALEVARLLLSGALRFEVVKRSPGGRYVLRMDVQVKTEDVRAFHRDRWDRAHDAHADDLVNRAAMKYGLHPTRTSPGVRGPRKVKA